ncbi:MAG TPA: dephospho-CoA kinase [Verrucomicrobiae bacterium]
MKLVGLTGGIGMGKTAASDYLVRRGEAVIDTDVLARNLVAPGELALREIVQAFGSGVLNPDGTLDRRTLATAVFTSQAKRKALEAILHPRIRKAWKDWAEHLRSAGCARAVVVIPLLFETGAENEFDLTVCVGALPATQSRRLTQRGWSEGEINTRTAAQLPIREKLERSDRVVWNEYSLQVLEGQINRIFSIPELPPASEAGGAMVSPF